jgi:lipoxygenase
VAAISEDIIKTNNKTTVPEKAVNFKVRAVVTVRNKHKEDLKATIVKQLDSFTDKIGRNVVLELISTDVDPSKSSKSYFSFWVLNKRVIIDH